MQLDRSHPCIVGWVPFNESWGVPDLPGSSAHRHYVRALYHWTKSLDPSSSGVGNDEWESISSAFTIMTTRQKDWARIWDDDIESRLFKRDRPGGRTVMMVHEKTWKHPIVLAESGGIAYGKIAKTSGDTREPQTAASKEEMSEY